MSDFAKNQLLKYGWTEGKGLGKNENGMTEAIKPKLKFDTTGVGHDSSEYNWWEHVYNKASSNVEINSNSSEIELKVKEKDAVEIATSKSELNLKWMKKYHKLLHGNFIKTSTLQDGKSTQDKDYPEDLFDNKEETKFSVLSDEEIFKACNGRTAHKGARHGLNLSGKLARLQRQEEEFLAKQYAPSTSSDWTPVETKRKKKRKYAKMEMETPVSETEDTLMIRLDPSPLSNDSMTESQETSPKPKSRKARLKEKRKMDDLTRKLSTSLDLSEDVIAPEKKRRKKGKKKDKNSLKQLGESESQLTEESQAQDNSDNNNSNSSMTQFAPVVEDPACNDDGFVSGDNLIEPSIKHSEETNRLNHRIQKKKKKNQRKRQRKKLEKLSQTLKTLDLSAIAEDVTEKKKGR